MQKQLRLPVAAADVRDMLALDVPGWESLLAQGRRHAISGRWYDLIAGADALTQLRSTVKDHLWSDRLRAETCARMARWEIDRIRYAFRDTGLRITLLKGAAYIARGLSAARARMISDVDILVPFDELSSAEAVLNSAGWQTDPDTSYDDQYYRQWMHELPPMFHQTRGTTLDVHHNLLPRTSRLCPPAEPLYAAITQVPNEVLWTLCPADMVIHSALHGFYSGEFANCFRDVLDVHELVTDFARVGDTFWETLYQRTELLGVGRAMYYALRYATRHMGTIMPAQWWRQFSRWAPAMPVRVAMDRAIDAVWLPSLPPSAWQRAAAWALYVRSHWIRMPPKMLAQHLWTKYRQRRETVSTTA